MKRVVLAVVVVVAGCSSAVPGEAAATPSEPVQLLTDSKPYDQARCSTEWDVGKLVVDPKYGVALDDSFTSPGGPRPVVWRVGFTGRRVGSEVEVLDPAGLVVATTGQWYRLDGGWSGTDPTLVLACRVSPHGAVGPAGPG